MLGNTGYSVEERQRLIREYIEDVKRVNVNDLVQRFEVSPSTMRNDLTTLERSGQIKRTHGWAIALSAARVGKESYASNRMLSNIPEKESIAIAANREIEDGDKIAILAGTTTMALAQTLTNKQNLTIVVNDLGIAKWLEDNTDHRVLIPGGYVRNHYSYILIEDDMIDKIHVDKVFFSCMGFSMESGATVSDYDLAVSQNKLLMRANRTILLCDSTKFGEVYFTRICSPEDINMIITDGEISRDKLETLRSQEYMQFLVANQKPYR